MAELPNEKEKMSVGGGMGGMVIWAGKPACPDAAV